MNTLGEALPAEIERCRQLLEDYRSIGQAGAIGARMIELNIEYAENALRTGSTSKMIVAYHALKDLE